MSRAFVKDADENAVEELPDRVISPHTNLVTPEGLAQIDAELDRVHRELQGLEGAERMRLGRDLRYWTARRAGAQVVEPHDSETVRFGSTVTIVRDGGRKQSFKLVGEDEADPEKGSLSYVAPLARALMGKEEGDVVRVGDSDVEIVSVA